MNPFEIRLELLKMARSSLELAYFQQNDHLQQKWNMAYDYAKHCGHPMPEKPEPIPFPTTEEVMVEAERMYKFVSTK